MRSGNITRKDGTPNIYCWKEPCQRESNPFAGALQKEQDQYETVQSKYQTRPEGCSAHGSSCASRSTQVLIVTVDLKVAMPADIVPAGVIYKTRL